MTENKIEIRQCSTVEDLSRCVALQRETFALPEIEISPVRHFIVTEHAGGFTLGAFSGAELVGFVLSVPAFFGNEKFFYSHMAAVKRDFQSSGIGAKLKWAQRETALTRNVKFIKWTFQPVQARNAFFNLEKLGVIIKSYEPNYYGTDYATLPEQTKKIGLDSDRLFAEWHLESEKVERLANGETCAEKDHAVKTIEIPNDWNALVKSDVKTAAAEQTRVKKEFQTAFAEHLVCRSFERSETAPRYLLFRENSL
ncbi:MAG: GNAT family N-acetyltransferase [Pyrinomonadaceae bacterium]|nr:GNAT family N-acetyltransferase [Pyrinomonadaceae bacterium]